MFICVGDTPLIQAATNGSLEIVKYLINEGANVNEKNMIPGK